MNIDEIKKGLECCYNTNCDDCPYYVKNKFKCFENKMLKDALNLINEQEKQIAALQREVEKKNDQTRTY